MTNLVYLRTSLRVVALLLFMAPSLPLHAETWLCDPPGIVLTVGENSFSLRLGKSELFLSPVFRTGAVLTFGKTKPGTDDERVITERMVRLDESNGHLVLLENFDGTPELTETMCETEH